MAAARAARLLGEPGQALALARQALPRAGELAPALRLEAARAALALGRDPLPDLRPLLGAGAPAGPRRAAGALLREAGDELPLATVRNWLGIPMQRGLRRDLRAAFAVRAGDAAMLAKLLDERDDDAAASRVALALAPRAELQGRVRLAVASALLASGHWREADAVLAATAVPTSPADRAGFSFLAGRAAYRLGALERAAGHFDEAITASRTAAERFPALVQRARVAELASGPEAALPFWDAARTAAPAEVEGWDGASRARAALGRDAEAAALVVRAPPQVARIAGPRLAAVLLARGSVAEARSVLSRLPASLPAVRILNVAARVASGDAAGARREAAALLADRRAGPWRELVLAVAPPPRAGAAAAAPRRDPVGLAVIAVELGVAQARSSLTSALAADPEWARLIAGAEPQPTAWRGPPALLAAAGLEVDAAELYADRFPDRTPEDLAWSARTLAAWGSGPAALSAGERLWSRLGVAATLVPDALLPAILPASLVGPCRSAAEAADVPADLLVGVIRRESRFDARARSNAGALGVAQFVPEAARRLGAEPTDLFRPEVSFALAGRELADLRRALGERTAPVAAAYNAGTAVVRSWLATAGKASTGDAERADAIFAAAIPYRETASYVLGVREGAELGRYLR